MGRPLKYLAGPPIETIQEFADEIAAGRYLISRDTGQRIHPGWASSWQFRLCAQAIKRRSLLRAIPNPKHPEFNKETI